MQKNNRLELKIGEGDEEEGVEQRKKRRRKRRSGRRSSTQPMSSIELMVEEDEGGGGADEIVARVSPAMSNSQLRKVAEGLDHHLNELMVMN